MSEYKIKNKKKSSLDVKALKNNQTPPIDTSNSKNLRKGESNKV
jgi:hypothetical protein